jgi:hypothetical protein
MNHDGSTATITPSRERTAGRAGNTGAPDMQEMMKRAATLGSPGPGHKVLEQFAGKWKATVTCWMDPSSPPMQSQATAEAQWVFGGRFLEEHFRGEFMGKPFNGRCIIGFNNVKQAYQSVWFDDMNTGLFCSEGKGDANSVTLEGTSSCAATGRTNIPFRCVYRAQGPDKHTFEMFDGSKGYARTMEIVYTRA